MKWFWRVSLAKSEKKEAKVTILMCSHTFSIGLVLSLNNSQNSEMIFYEVEILKTIIIIEGRNLGNCSPCTTLSAIFIKNLWFQIYKWFCLKNTHLFYQCGNWP